VDRGSRGNLLKSRLIGLVDGWMKKENSHQRSKLGPGVRRSSSQFGIRGIDRTRSSRGYSQKGRRHHIRPNNDPA
jgi:hypothetical protein